MLFTLGVGSSVSMVETILTCVKDEFQFLHKHKAKTALAFCLFYMLLGLPLTTDVSQIQNVDSKQINLFDFRQEHTFCNCWIIMAWELPHFCMESLKCAVSFICMD